MNRETQKRLLKTLPGFLISAFFLWYTFRGLHLAEFREVRLAAPVWIIGVVAFSIAGYTVRCFRWWSMLRSFHSRFADCARVFMTSLAANNILPLRIGDVMRIFTYAPDLNASPSVVLSTVILEKLFDIFSLVLFVAMTIHSGNGVSAHTRVLVKTLFVVSAGGLILLTAGARTLERPLRALFAKLPEKLGKVEHWLLLAMEAVRSIGILGMLWILVLSLVAWTCEGLLYLSAMRLIALPGDWAAPWQTVAVANLSFLIPSSPGGIGPFEWACKSTLINHGASPAAGGVFGLLIHAWLLITLTAVGGAMFLQHRLHLARRKPLLEEIETLPATLP